ncbi:MAG: endo alpha-1,4 polygalactosaminidase [Pseudomonadota bacterium]
MKIICYFSAGTVESFRDDASQFLTSSIGEQYESLVDERWIDYRNFEAFADIMRNRMDVCKAKGFDAIETDNVDAHNYETVDANGNVVNIGTNFRISLDDSIRYIRWLGVEAHSRGLSIGLKNAEEMAVDVVSDVDWMLTEDCYVDNWCQEASVFIDNNKPVFMTEYEDLLPDFTPACALAKSLGFFAIWRDPSLADGTYLACE